MSSYRRQISEDSQPPSQHNSFPSTFHSVSHHTYAILPLIQSWQPMWGSARLHRQNAPSWKCCANSLRKNGTVSQIITNHCITREQQPSQHFCIHRSKGPPTGGELKAST